MAILDLFRGNQNYSRGGGGTYIGGHSKRTKSGQSVTTSNALEDATVLSCVNVIAQGIAQLPLNLIREADQAVSTSPISNLTKRPNDYQTPYELKYGLVSTLLTYGNAYLKIVRTANGRPTQLLPMDPNGINYELNQAGYPVYSYRGSDERIPNEDILHFKDTVLFDIAGMSRVTLAATRVGALKAADEQLEETFKNGLNLLTTFEFTEDVSPEKKEAWAEAVKESFASGGSNRGGAMLIENGTMHTHKAASPADTDLRQLREALIQEIAAVFRVPAFMVGGSGSQTYSNVRQMQTAFYRDTLAPILTNIEQVLDMKLKGKNYDECFKFDVTDLLKGDLESQSSLVSKLVTSGVWTPNEGRVYTGQMPIESGDVLHTPKPINTDDYRGTPNEPNAMNPENTGEDDINE